MAYLMAHQNVGINRCGKYWETCRTKGPENQKADGGTQKAETRNQKWRRWTGMVGADALTLSRARRRAGIRRFIGKIEAFVVKGLSNQIQVFVAPPACGVESNWGGAIDGWRRAQTAGTSVEEVCLQFGISKTQLGALTREYCSISARELLNGWKIRGLKSVLMGQLKEAAFRLWGAPGEMAYRRCMADQPHPPAPSPFHREGEKGACLRDSRDAGDALGSRALRKRSRYFRTRPSEFLGISDGEEELIRLRELLGKLDETRSECGWTLAGMAAGLGFENAGAFGRACLNVMGKKLAQLERALAWEIVRYYLAAEDRKMREICTRDDAFGFMAREIYCGDAETLPAEPFCDRWAAFETSMPGWLNKMQGEFG